MSLADRIRANTEAAPWVVLEVQNLEVDLKKTQQNNMTLCNAIKDYAEALSEIHQFINGYLQGGGDPTEMPPRWHDLDQLRQIRFAIMLQAAGLTS